MPALSSPGVTAPSDPLAALPVPVVHDHPWPSDLLPADRAEAPDPLERARVLARVEAWLDREGLPLDPVLARLHGSEAWPWPQWRETLAHALRLAWTLPRGDSTDAARAAWRGLAARLARPDPAGAAPLLLPGGARHAVVLRALRFPGGTYREIHREDGGPRGIELRGRDGNDAPAPPGWSGEGAATLKLHALLLGLAEQGGGRVEAPLPALLDALGYRRMPWGAHDARTVEQVRRRLGALGGATLADGPDGNARPLWRVEEAPGDLVRAAPIALPTNGAASPVPRALLALGVDGNGNEQRRVALTLGLAFALDPALNRALTPGGCTVRIGRALERAGWGDLDALVLDAARRGNRARRLRAYLCGADGLGGAFQLLEALGVCRVLVRDERAFWSSGRRWLPEFWRARVTLRRDASAASVTPPLLTPPLLTPPPLTPRPG